MTRPEPRLPDGGTGAAASILVVEDDPRFRAILARRIGAAGYRVRVAGNGREGLAEVARDVPDLILADWMMPEMDGVEFCRAVKGDPATREAYFILLTAKDDQADKIAALDVGADDYLVKPCPDEELLARVRVGLRIRALQREIAAAQHRAALVHMAVTVGHEINNPLSGVLGYLELSREALGRGEIDRLPGYLAHCEAAAGRVRDIVGKLNGLSDPVLVPYYGGEMMVDLWVACQGHQHSERNG